MELVDIYDSNRSIIRIGDRSEVRTMDEYLLVVHSWLIDDTGHILLQKRASCKKFDPNKWGVTGGFARTGESSAEACIRETMEEVGICLTHSQMQRIITFTLGNLHYDIWISRIKSVNKPLVLQSSEVSDTAWISLCDFDKISFEDGMGELLGEKIITQRYFYQSLLKQVIAEIV